MLHDENSAKWAENQTPDGFEGDKFIEIDDSDSGDFILRLFFDAGGRYIPTNDWFAENSTFCSDQYRLNRTPELILEIDFNLSDSIMEMNLLNAETNESIKSHEGAILPDEDWFIALITEMFNEFDDENIFGVFEAECGLFEGSISIFFDSKMESEVLTPDFDGPLTINVAVESEIKLTYSEEENLYTGESTLSHRLYENSALDMLTAAGISCSADLTSSGIRVELDPQEFTSLSEFVLYITAPVSGDEAPWESIECEGFDQLPIDGLGRSTMWFAPFVLFHLENVAEDREAFQFTGWEHSGEAGVIGSIESDQVLDLTDFDEGFDGAESMPVTETTRIEIRNSE